MKKYTMWTLTALMFMAPAVYAADTVTPAAPTGPAAKGLETTQPSKDMAKAHAPSKAPKKKKHVKPLTPEEDKEMQRRLEVTEPPTPAENGVK